MVCQRCIEAVEEEFDRIGVAISSIQLGEVSVSKPLNENETVLLKKNLVGRGFELVEDKNRQIVEQIKALIVNSIHNKVQSIPVNYSTYLEKELGRDYSYLSALFSSTVGMTIERYVIQQKLEKVKELIVYDELNLSQIADLLGYSSVQHLSTQFKKFVGITPSQFKRSRNHQRQALDKLTN